jgi:hypothetical protein
MKKNFLTKNSFAAMALAFVVLLFACKKNDDIVVPATPVIVGVTTASGIASGPKNTVIIIKGSNFITDLSKIQVTVNGKICNVLSATSDSIKATLPAYCGSGNVVVTINGERFNGPFFNYIYTYTLSSLTDGVVGYADGPVATAKFEEFVGITIDGADNIYTSQYDKPRVRKISADGVASTMAGNGIPGHVNGNGTAAQLGKFDFCSTDAAGNIYVADQGGYIRKIDINKNVTDFYTLPGFYPTGIKVMPSGNVYFHSIDRIGKISPAGVLTWLAISATGSDDVDGTLGTAQFNLYGGIEVSKDESKIYVSDWTHGTSTGNKIKLLTNNSITTIAGKTGLSDGSGDALNVGFKLISCSLLDNNGGLYIVDEFNGKIKYLKDGQVNTILGTPGIGDVDGDLSVAKISFPHGLVMDSKGNLFISNVVTNKIKKLTID